jgi:hypothetical protein
VNLFEDDSLAAAAIKAIREGEGRDLALALLMRTRACRLPESIVEVAGTDKSTSIL